jgi:hypothetical protein
MLGNSTFTVSNNLGISRLVVTTIFEYNNLRGLNL